VGVDTDGIWREILNSDSEAYGGSGMGNLGEVRAEAIPVNNRKYSLNLTLPPLGVLFLRSERS
jgi:1,4-alpha-glucan branching enzyme